MMTPEQLEEVKARAEGAEEMIQLAGRSWTVSWPFAGFDEFYRYARRDMLELVAEVERLRAEVQRLIAALELERARHEQAERGLASARAQIREYLRASELAEEAPNREFDKLEAERDAALQQAEQACRDVRCLWPVVQAAIRYVDAQEPTEDLAARDAFYDAVSDYRETEEPERK